MLHIGWNIDTNDWYYKNLTYRNFDNEINWKNLSCLIKGFQDAGHQFVAHILIVRYYSWKNKDWNSLKVLFSTLSVNTNKII